MDLGYLFQTPVLRGSENLLTRQKSVKEKVRDSPEGQSWLLHHLRTTGAHPETLTGLISVAPRGVDDTVLAYDREYDCSSTSSSELHKGYSEGSRRSVGALLKSTSSKWGEAEKWLVSYPLVEVAVNSSAKSDPLIGQGLLNFATRVNVPNEQDSHTIKSVYQTNGSTFTPNGTETLLLGDNGRNAKAMTASRPEQSFDFARERMKTMDAVRGPSNAGGGAHNFAFIPVPAPSTKARSINSFDCYPVADEPDNMKEVNIIHEGKHDEPFFEPMLRTDKPTSDTIVSAYCTPPTTLRSVSMRDMGTEMTPLASQEPSRTGTPIRATSPTMCSPVSSCPSTPERATPATSSRQDSENVSAPEGVSKASKAGEKERQLRTKGDVDVLVAQQQKSNLAAWSTKEEEDEDASKALKNVDSEEVKKKALNTRAAVWEEAEQAKYMARYSTG